MADHRIFQLVYVSSAVEFFDDRQLHDLLQQSRGYNQQNGITGLLLYKDGNFMQLLEGEATSVRELFRRIGDDVRHRDLITLLQTSGRQRDFPDWSMGFRQLDRPVAIPGYSDFLELPLDADTFGEHPSQCQRLLRVFRRNMD